MIVLEFKLQGKTTQYAAIDEAIRTAQFVRNKAIRFWMDNQGVGQKELYRLSKAIRQEFSFANSLNSSACQAAIERAYSSISRFYDNCKKGIPGKKGYPKFQKNNRSVEYKTSGWKLSETRKQITFTDKKEIGKLKLKGTWDLNFYPIEQIKRVRLVRRADGYYTQFLISVENKVETQPTGKIVGLDMGLQEFYTDSNGHSEPNPSFYRTGEKRLKFYQRRVFRKKKGSANRKKAINIQTDMDKTVADLRKDYTLEGLSETEINPNPFIQFKKWFEQALAAQLPEPNAMTLATATPDGQPSARMVLLKDFDERGFVLFTNYNSQKGQELAANPQAALVFWWAELERQVRIVGTVEKISPEQSDSYFEMRPPNSRLGAWASNQSEVIVGREVLEQQLQDFQRKYENQEVPRPPHWGGYRIIPREIEFWQGRSSRLHDRLLYTRADNHNWKIERLSP